MTTLRVYKARGSADSGTALRVHKARGFTSPTSGNTLQVYKARGLVANLQVVRVTGPLDAEPFELIDIDASTSTYDAGASFTLTQTGGPPVEFVNALGPVFKVQCPAVDDDVTTLAFQIRITDASGTTSTGAYSLALYPVSEYTLTATGWEPIENRTISTPVVL